MVRGEDVNASKGSIAGQSLGGTASGRKRMRRGRTLAGTMTLAVALATFLALAGPAWAAQFGVNSRDDATDAAPGNGVCSAGTPTGGPCTLRAAVQESNALAGLDTITVPRGNYVLTIPGIVEDESATGDLDITDSVVIDGAGARSTTIDGNGLDRVLDVPGISSDVGPDLPSDATVSLSGVTITGGLSSIGGGIRNDGTLRVERSAISNNTTGANGGGIFNNGTANLVNSTISNNTAVVAGGGIGNFGSAALTFLNVSLNANSAPAGANLSNDAADATTFENTIVANAQGGGTNCAGPGTTSDGNNLDDDGSCDFDRSSDINNEDPRLGALRDNGGPTNTHALQKGSPAINAGDDAAAPPTDQRGVERPQGKRSDIGAFEFKPSGSGSGGDGNGSGKGKCKGKGQGQGQGQSQCQNADGGNVRT